MALEYKTEIVDKDTQAVASLLVCPCGNKTFFVLDTNVPVCSACMMTNSEAQTFVLQNG